MLNAPQVREAANQYVRILIPVPAGDLFVQRYGVKRYGLLVLDADGRRAGAIDLLGLRNEDRNADVLARRLDALASCRALETHEVALSGRPSDFEAMRQSVLQEKGIHDVSVKDNVLNVVGALPPKVLAQHARARGVSLAYRNPVPVKVRNTRSPGIWYLDGRRAYVTRLLLHPTRLGVREGGVEMRTFTVPGVRIGSIGHRVLLATIKVPGVLTVFPDLASETISVVGSKDPATWKAVRIALERATPK